MAHRTSPKRKPKHPAARKRPAQKQAKPAPQGVDVNSPEGQQLANEMLKKIAPSMPTPQSPWEAARRSPVHRLPVLCNGESTAARNPDGSIIDGTGNKCAHYWAFRRIPELQNSEGVEKGETVRFCRNWKSADGPMEFGEGREHMANACDCYEKSDRPYVAELEQAPPTPPKEGDVQDDVPPPPDFDPGIPVEQDYVQTHILGFLPEELQFEKDAPQRRWVLHSGDAGAPLFFVYFRCAFDPEEYANDSRYPRGDVRRYDKTRLLALEHCLSRLPLVDADFATMRRRPDEVWRPVLNRYHTVTAAEALAD